MKPTTILLSLCLVSAMLTTRALAQNANSSDGDAAAYITINLAAGFPLDPFFVSVNAGGEVEASTLSAGCSGYINRNPTLTVNWSGETDVVKAFYISDDDPVLVVQTPDGNYLCNDDANALLLDPVVRIVKPAEGRYNIWAGSYNAHQLLPGVLVLTTRPAVKLGTFQLGNLIKRQPIPEELPSLEELQDEGASVLDALKKLEASGARIADLAAGLTEPITQTITITGEVPAFEIPVGGGLCNGYVNTLPDYSFNWHGETKALRIFFEGDGDTTLLVRTPDGRFLCNDDGAKTLNPLIAITNPEPGRYSVFVGRVHPEQAVTGNLTLTESTDLAPAVLEQEK